MAELQSMRFRKGNRVPIGANLACFPWAIFQPQKAVDRLAEIADFVQGVPFRGVDRVKWQADCPAYLAEGPWEIDPVPEAFRLPPLRKSVVTAALLFGGAEQASRRQKKILGQLATQINCQPTIVDHKGFVPGTYLEINAGMFMLLGDIRMSLERHGEDIGLCLDLNHLCQDPRPDQIARRVLGTGYSYAYAVEKYRNNRFSSLGFKGVVNTLLEGFTGPVIIHAAPLRNGEYEGIIDEADLSVDALKTVMATGNVADRLKYVLGKLRPNQLQGVVAEAVPQGILRMFNPALTFNYLTKYMQLLRSTVREFSEL